MVLQLTPEWVLVAVLDSEVLDDDDEEADVLPAEGVLVADLAGWTYNSVFAGLCIWYASTGVLS